jgi:hypothetical protein
MPEEVPKPAHLHDALLFKLHRRGHTYPQGQIWWQRVVPCVFGLEVDKFLVGSLACDVECLISFVPYEGEVIHEACLDDRLLLFEQDLCVLFSLVQGVCLCIALEATGFAIDPFKDAGICVKRGWVSRNCACDNLVPCPLAFLVNAEEGFLREASNGGIEDQCPRSCSMLISSQVVGPPVVFCDQDVGNLEALEALLPAAGVLSGRVSKVPIE